MSVDPYPFVDDGGPDRAGHRVGGAPGRAGFVGDVRRPRALPGHPQVIRLSGLASTAAGAFVFMMGVADRLFPAAGQRLSIFLVEMATFMVFVGGCAGACVSYCGGLR